MDLVRCLIEHFRIGTERGSSWHGDTDATRRRGGLRITWPCVLAAFVVLSSPPSLANYVNFESSHVDPIALTPSASRLLVVNTPDALLEIFNVQPDGSLVPAAAVPVGLEPVTVRARSDSEAWVVNNLSDSVSVIDLNAGAVIATLHVGDEPNDVVFAAGRAFVSVSGEDHIAVFQLADLSLPPVTVPVFGRNPRALAVSNDGAKVYAVVLKSGNQTTVVNANVIESNDADLDPARVAALGIDNMQCDGGPPPAYPDLPPGIQRNPALTDPLDGVPKVGLIVRWDSLLGQWRDEDDQDWTHCLPMRLPDEDLFIIDSSNLAVTSVSGIGTSLFEVSVQPASDLIYVPNTNARNFVRFEHELGLTGHLVDNRLSVIDPSAGHAVTLVDLNTHIDRGSDPTVNLAEREASISQPGMMVWTSDGSKAYVTAIGSRKLFEVDGTCLAGGCIFGPNRSAPRAVETGEGPTGVALNEAAERLYVLNRFSNSIALIDALTLTRLEQVPLHDPSSETILAGRRFLYDAIIGSGHGDAACSSCHISGDMDGLAWDLGDPTGDLVPYTTPNDNVRFIVPLGGAPVTCSPSICAAHEGFDPQKGPMTTQTLRGMLEPLHWRGDRATMNDFNPAFVGLMGTANIAGPGEPPAGLSAADMEAYRQFALGIRFPPNPLRNVDDSLPNVQVQIPETAHTGNPSSGETLFNSGITDAGQPCQSCHTHPFGAAGGQLGGLAPQEPTSAASAALFNGDADESPHSDLKVAHMRNLYAKTGMRFGPDPLNPPDARSGFGLTHDGSVPGMLEFLSISVFTINADQVRDLSAFSLHFPTGTKPCVGQNLTVPEGMPPTGGGDDEMLLVTLEGIADLADPNRHGELVASAPFGDRVRAFHLDNGQWNGDLAGDPPLSTLQLREQATGPVSFLCATIGSGPRLGGNRDEDPALNGDDCAPDDPEIFPGAVEICDGLDNNCDGEIDEVGGCSGEIFSSSFETQ